MAKVGCCTKRVDLFYQRTARASSSAGSTGLLVSGVYVGLKINYVTKLAHQLEHTVSVPRYAMETFILGTDLWGLFDLPPTRAKTEWVGRPPFVRCIMSSSLRGEFSEKEIYMPE